MKEKENLKEVFFPSVTVSIPVYKSRGLLKKAVKSILRQTYSNFTLVIVSDADPHNSIKEIKQIEDKRLNIVKLEKNIGRYAIDHLVVSELTTNDYWIPFDSDDWCEETYLIRLVEKLFEFPDSDVIFCGQMHHNGHRQRRRAVKKWNGNSNFVWHAHMSALWRREFLLESNLTNPNFRVGWDSIVTSVPWLIGKVNVVDDFLYHRVARSGSLTTDSKTGFGSEHRNRVKTYVIELWKELVKNKDDKEKLKQILLRSRNEQY